MSIIRSAIILGAVFVVVLPFEVGAATGLWGEGPTAVEVEMVPYPGTEEPPPAIDPAVLDATYFPRDGWNAEKVRAILAKPPPPLLTPAQLDVLMPSPPRNSSAATRAELDQLLVMQANDRRPDALRLIVAENKENGVPNAFAADHLFDPARRPRTQQLLESVGATINYYVLQRQMKYQRAMPSQIDSRLTSALPSPGVAGYPSAHAALAEAYARILSQLDPLSQSSYAQRAADIARRRSIAGVEYPSDAAAGRKLADAVVDAALAMTPMQEQFKAAQAEYAEMWK